MENTREQEARMSTVCPVCGAAKEGGENGPIVCWGKCWKGAGGLKWTTMTTEQWLEAKAKNN